ncbi:MAG: 3'-5' exonuclease [Pirellulaceae bacterium]|jgi:hypothetical protein|nr:3'-5' exonuclease [Pirellulaceae bacterium]MDP7018843.1 3'-5' exonuclease [Pirellulaceae bacterium]
MSPDDIRYFVFDVESVADGRLVSALRYPGEGLEPEEAVTRYRAELMEKYGSDFVPYTFQVPVSVVVGKVRSDFQLVDLVALDEPDYRSHIITQTFWKGWSAYRQPTLVSFNGRTFDMPLMELAAFRYGVELPEWFDLVGRTYEQPRNRYNIDSHLDLHDLLTNYGASRFTGGLNLAAHLLGKPGKMDVQGYMVQDLYDEDRLADINDYCRCDVLDTYFVFLRASVMLGRLPLEREKELVNSTRQWLEERVDQRAVFAAYLERWGDWDNPWSPSAAVDQKTESC